MPPNDQEPRYRLVDSNGNVVGSLFQNADGNVEIQDETGTGSVFGPDGIVTPAIDAGSVSTETVSINSQIHFASDDSELDTVLSNATDGDTIILGTSEFSQNRTIGDRLQILARSGMGREAGRISGDWQFEERVELKGAHLLSAEITINDELSVLQNCNAFNASDNTVTVNADKFRFYGGFSIEVVFASGTSGGIVDSSTGTSVVDNGNNTVGDIA